MSASEYNQWLKRGRAHQWNGRAIDALLCFRRAQRVHPRASDAMFHLGEVLWQLGSHAEAERIWSEAGAVDADNRLLKATRQRFHAAPPPAPATPQRLPVVN